MSKETSTEMTISEQASVPTAASGYVMPEFKVKELITIPLIEFVTTPEMRERKEYANIVVTIESDFFEGDEIKDSKFKEPPTMLRITDVRDGRTKNLMVKTVLEGDLRDLIERDEAKDLIGRSFVIVDYGIATERDKDYRTYGITEIELA